METENSSILKLDINLRRENFAVPFQSFTYVDNTSELFYSTVRPVRDRWRRMGEVKKLVAFKHILLKA